MFPFENRGAEVGGTLAHPHGQIYAYRFVPPISAAEQEHERRHLARHGRIPRADHIDAEVADGRRLLYSGTHVVAFVPACARYPYEVRIAPRRAAPHLGALQDAERADFAIALESVLLRYDGLWQKPFPYVMVFHQAPTDGQPHPEAHLHVEFYPPLRDSTRLKFLAGTEIGAGAFAMDGLPEVRAAELRAVQIDVGSHA